MEPSDTKHAERAVFLSYRRADSAESAGRIYDRLVERFSEARVFKDVDSIQPGVPFADYIVESIGQSAVELVIIGPRWLSVSSGWNRRRLDDPADFVRLEIEAALRAGVPVIPVLVMGAALPPAQRLPDTLKRLVERNAIQVRPDPDFRRDMDRVIAAVEYWMARPRLAPVISAPVASAPQASALAAPAISTPAASPGQSLAPEAALAATASVQRESAPVRRAMKPYATARPTRRPLYQSLIAVSALLVVVGLLGATLQALGLLHGKTGASLPAAALTQTVLARSEQAQSPTVSYVATAPGSCDRGALKADWTIFLEDDHVSCQGGKAVVTGPAILDFDGVSGMGINSAFSLTLSNIQQTSSAAIILSLGLDSGIGHGGGAALDFKILSGNRFATHFSTDVIGPSGSLAPARNGVRQVKLTYDPGDTTLTVTIDGKLVTHFTLHLLNSGPYVFVPTLINPFDIKVDSGASVTLSNFTIAPSA
jgi:hypothetical protein